jgi:hypothetical protein
MENGHHNPKEKNLQEDIESTAPGKEGKVVHH